MAAAAVWAGRSPVDEPLEVHLPGGALTITVLRDTETVTMKGPAKLVFQGQTRVE